MIGHGDLTTQQWDLLYTALQEKANRHEGIAKRTENSGYGKASTMDKADHHYGVALECHELVSHISSLIE